MFRGFVRHDVRRQNVGSLMTDLWEGDDDNSLGRNIYFKWNWRKEIWKQIIPDIDSEFSVFLSHTHSPSITFFFAWRSNCAWKKLEPVYWFDNYSSIKFL